MDAIQAIAATHAEHFGPAVRRLDAIGFTLENRQRAIRELRDDRARVLTLLALAPAAIEPLLIQAIAQGWSAGDLSLQLSKQRSAAKVAGEQQHEASALASPRPDIPAHWHWVDPAAASPDIPLHWSDSNSPARLSRLSAGDSVVKPASTAER